MSANKSGFIFHFDCYPILTSLPLEQRGLLITLLCLYADRVWREPGTALDEILEQFPQLSNEAVMACRFMGAAILRDTQRWLTQREYREQRRQTQSSPPYTGKKVPGMVPDPNRQVRQ